jgi:NRAMP (natural resistance-associated macrophage protein)-like metal ion transporter
VASERRPSPTRSDPGAVPAPERRKQDPVEDERFRRDVQTPARRSVVRSLGLGLITGAADDDPSAIGTYASAGAAFGPAFLWTAPVTCPMMFAVVYLCAKVGQVTGQGLFTIIRRHYPRWILFFLLVTALTGNIIEAAADIGGMAAALNLLIPVPVAFIVVIVGGTLLVLQIWTSYTTIRNIFRWLALTLLAYVGSAILAKPDWRAAIRGTLIPTIHFNREFLAMLVAVVGTTLSAYLYSWQSNLEVEDQIARGRRRLDDRAGVPTEEELRHAARDIAFGMFFSNLIMYFIILSTAATLFKAGKTDISTAAEAAQALRPLTGDAAGLLFAVGVIGVGFLAVPVMTTGAAYDLSQAFDWRHGLHWKPAEAKMFYGAIAMSTLIATGINFLGVNPIKALVYAGIVQGFSTPFLTLAIMLVTNDRQIMGRWVNRRAINVLGWLTTGAMFAATIGLVLTWIT